MKSLVTNLTLEDHRELAHELKQIRERLVLVLCDDCSGMKVECKLRKLTCRALNALDEVRCELDNDLARKFPENFHPSVYYGPINDINIYPLGETKTSPQLNQ